MYFNIHATKMKNVSAFSQIYLLGSVPISSLRDFLNYRANSRLIFQFDRYFYAFNYVVKVPHMIRANHIVYSSRSIPVLGFCSSSKRGTLCVKLHFSQILFGGIFVQSSSLIKSLVLFFLAWNGNQQFPLSWNGGSNYIIAQCQSSSSAMCQNFPLIDGC